MLFGFVVAAIAGFLLTAIPNWTGRMPLQGVPLAVLVGVWLIGRLAVGASAWIGAGIAAVLDLSFLTLLLGVVLREILAGRNWRNLPMPVVLGGLLVANALTHADAVGLAATGPLGQRLGIGIVILLIGLVGGRIIPSFTLNWLKKQGESNLPASFGALDRGALGLAAAALAIWVVAPESLLGGAALIAAGVASLVRLARWRGHLTLAEPLVWSLHLGFAWVGVGLLLVGLSAFLPDVPLAAGLHALTVGAMGGMTAGGDDASDLGPHRQAAERGPVDRRDLSSHRRGRRPSGRRAISGRRLPPFALDLRAGMERRLRPLRRALRADALPVSRSLPAAEVAAGLIMSMRVCCGAPRDRCCRAPLDQWRQPPCGSHIRSRLLDLRQFLWRRTLASQPPTDWRTGAGGVGELDR